MVQAYLSSGQLAALIGRSPETLRRYESRGLIPAGRRDPVNGRRYWTPDEAERIRQRLQPVEHGASPPRVHAVTQEVDGEAGT